MSGKPPKIILLRLISIVRTQLERFRLPRRVLLSERQLLKELRAESLDSLWNDLAARPFPALTSSAERASLSATVGENEYHIICERAELALRHTVDLLGSGPTNIGPDIDWHTDFKTGISWSPKYFADFEYNNPDQPSDVKVPWERIT